MPECPQVEWLEYWYWLCKLIWWLFDNLPPPPDNNATQWLTVSHASSAPMFRAKFAQTSQDRSATRSQENRAKASQERTARVFPARCRGKSAPRFRANNARLCQDRVARVCQGNNVPMCRSRAAAACQGKVARVCQDKCANRCQENSARLLSLFTLVASRSTQSGSKILEHIILLGRRASKPEDDRHIPISAISSFLCPLA